VTVAPIRLVPVPVPVPVGLVPFVVFVDGLHIGQVILGLPLYILTLVNRKLLARDTLPLEGICCGTRRPDASCLGTSCPKVICPGTRRPDSTCRDTLRLEGMYPGTRRPAAICLDTRRPEGILYDL